MAMSTERPGSSRTIVSRRGDQGCLETALVQWRTLRGTEHVAADPDSLAHYQRNTLPEQRRIAAALRPASTDEVCQVVQIAAAHGIPLYPISRGKNFGYGTMTPVLEGNVVLDLGRMQRIEVNRELAYAVVEPGVTQQQLHDYLKEHHIQLWIDPTGAGPDASLLGNALERGYGITPYGDHFAQICGMEVVLADGETLRTGFGHFDAAEATHVFPRGMGPYLDGLFTQSNFGIVTRMGLWLMPVPEHFELCLFSAEEDAALEALIEQVRRLLLQGSVRSSVNLMHRDRVLTVMQQYPWEEMQGQTPLSAEVSEAIGRRRKLGTWNGVAALYGTRGEVRAARRTIRRALRGHVSRLAFISQTTLRLLQRFPRLLSLATGLNIPEIIEAVRPTFGILSGTPNRVAMRTPYWRHRQPAPEQPVDPAADGCGLIWFAPVIPMTPRCVEQFRAIVEPILASHGFECCITLTTVNARSFDCTLPILYDRTDPREAARARRCYDALLSACAEAGYLPYRLDVRSMHCLAERSRGFWEVCGRLKRALDPLGILAPGRYEPAAQSDLADERAA